jgi:diguanylate cyclase (GGDEF)-like protein
MCLIYGPLFCKCWKFTLAFRLLVAGQPMNAVRISAALALPLIVAATAWISPGASTNVPSFADSVVAIFGFGLTLAEGTSMGFLFIIFSLGHLSWGQTFLMADAAIALMAAVKPASPIQLLRSLGASSLAVVASHITYQLANLPVFYAPLNLYLAATVCFVAMNAFRWRREVLWMYPYYVVGGSLAVWFPLPVLQPLALAAAWMGFRAFESRLARNSRELRSTASLHLRTIEAISLAIEARDTHTGRSRRVPIYAEAIAQELDMPEWETEALRVAALLYDVGELAVPDHIILKPDKLTPEEFEKVKTHSSVGAEILECVSFPYPAAPLVRSHHERWDGRGYPQGLKGEQIPRGARIIAVLDALDALASDRQHRRAMPLEQAVEKIAAESGAAFDPMLVELIRRNWRRWEVKVKEHTGTAFTESIAAAQREAKALFGLAQKLCNSLEPEVSYEAVRSALEVLVPHGGLAVWLERAGALRMEYWTGIGLAHWRLEAIPMGRGVSGRVAASGLPVRNGNAAEDFGEQWNSPQEAAAPGGRKKPFRYALSAPLSAPGAHGALTVYSAGETEFTREHERVLSVIAPKLSAAIANAQRYREVKRRASTDTLTGLPNAEALACRLKALKAPCAVVVCDLDGFKHVNDRWGHMTGNRVLEQLATAFRNSCRDGDFIARLGGDEFVLLLEGLSPAEVGHRLDHFREMVRKVGREVTGAEGLDASFGVAFHPKDGTSAEELLPLADAKMYRIKAGRKSKVIEFRKGA